MVWVAQGRCLQLVIDLTVTAMDRLTSPQCRSVTIADGNDGTVYWMTPKVRGAGEGLRELGRR